MDTSNMTLEGFFLADYERMRNRVQELERQLVERVPSEYGCNDLHMTFDAVKVSINSAYYLHYPEYGFTSDDLENALTMADDELWDWCCTERKSSASWYSTYRPIVVEHHKFQYTLRFSETRTDQILVTDGNDDSLLYNVKARKGEKCLDVWQDEKRMNYIKGQALEYMRLEIKDSIPKLREKEAKVDD